MVKCFVKAMKNLISERETPRVINVGTGVNYSLNELVEVINSSLGTDIKPTYKDVRIPGYVDATLADCALIHEYLGEAKVDLREGVKMVIAALNK